MSVTGDPRRSLEEERDFLLVSLADLDRELAAGDISTDDYLELRARYTARAAAVLRALGGDGADAGPVGDGEAFPPRRTLGRRIVATVVAASVLAGGASWAVAAAFGERLPGAQATGSIPLTTEERLALARQQMGAGEALEAIKTYDAVLREDPKNVEALAYRGWLLRLAGLPDKALEYLNRAIAADPSYPDARFFKGMVLYEDKGDPEAGLVELRAFLAADPPPALAEQVRQVIARAEAEAASRRGNA